MFWLCTRNFFFPETGLTAFRKCTGFDRSSFSSFSNSVRFTEETMKFTVLEPDGKAHEFVLTGDKLGQEVLDKVRSTRNAERANMV